MFELGIMVTEIEDEVGKLVGDDENRRTVLADLLEERLAVFAPVLLPIRIAFPQRDLEFGEADFFDLSKRGAENVPTLGDVIAEKAGMFLVEAGEEGDEEVRRVGEILDVLVDDGVAVAGVCPQEVHDAGLSRPAGRGEEDVLGEQAFPEILDESVPKEQIRGIDRGAGVEFGVVGVRGLLGFHNGNVAQRIC
jgi:hypothetical protein